ncbi:dihydroorotase [Butyrivibrio sp. XPD2006]|uniref:dihydroorotase n=1 Tax=Butyrivibrio sp. XPD2006 TaxID=1280668 RepID=UPI0003B5D9DF|nr:dihydroorotase [Butyrivibrio sp. XPD2006]
MLLIKNGRIMDPATETEGVYDMLIDGDRIVKIGMSGSLDEMARESLFMREAGGEAHEEGITEIDAGGCIVAPGLVDGHVHFRDPGFTYKEDIDTGAAAAARGGFTSVIMMGNTDPHMDNVDTVKDVLERGSKTGINVYTCGNVTMNMEGKELTPMDKLVEAGAVLFTDDGKPITDAKVMERACEEAVKLDRVISLHEEDPSFITDNGINAGEVAEELGLKGSPRDAEISMVKRDIEIAKKTGATIVVQHISAAESVELIRQARREWVKVFAEATPHHFTLTQDAVRTHGTLAKMNPPLRFESDRLAIIQGLKDGTIDMIATDHAPHSKEEKAKSFREAPSGITGLETSLALGIRELVRPGHLSMMELLSVMSAKPAALYGLDAGTVREGSYADIVIFNPDEEWVFDKSVSKASNTPFLGEKLPGKIFFTICRGKIVYKAD